MSKKALSHGLLGERTKPLAQFSFVWRKRDCSLKTEYYAELNPVIGSEQGGTRPVLIISNDIGNKHSPTVIIAPITSRVHTKAKLPTHTLIKDFDGLDKNSIILFEQIRTIDKQRLREYLGTLDRRFIHCADKALAISIGLAKKD